MTNYILYKYKCHSSFQKENSHKLYSSTLMIVKHFGLALWTTINMALIWHLLLNIFIINVGMLTFTWLLQTVSFHLGKWASCQNIQLAMVMVCTYQVVLSLQLRNDEILLCFVFFYLPVELPHSRITYLRMDATYLWYAVITAEVLATLESINIFFYFVHRNVDSTLKYKLYLRFPA